MGERFDEAAETYKVLSDGQQKLSTQDWTSGPRLLRGVAGSGKTVVLANNLARRVERGLKGQSSLFDGPPRRPRLLAVCNNRTLVPFIQHKVSLAFQQRNGQSPPDDAVEVAHYNRLLWRLSRKGLWRYQQVGSATDDVRVRHYLEELEHVREHQRDLYEAVAYDAIYVDEGQDFLDDDYRLLKGLCRTPAGGEPNLYVFYDDAQNLLGRPRPNWKSLGLNLRGRAVVMARCYRNVRPIIEAAFNVLYGRFAEDPCGVPTMAFGDVGMLKEKGLIEESEGRYLVKFAVRDGMPPRLTLASDAASECRKLADRVRWLVCDQRVRPEDILVLAYSWRRVEALAEVIMAAGLPAIREVRIASSDQDRGLRERGCLCLSTVASSKGYDAYCTLLASANEFPTDLSGRATFYVGCTRAIEYLEVFAYSRAGLANEFAKALELRTLSK